MTENNDAKTLVGYEALVCVTGGIAAYKAADLVSKLVQAGCGVSVAMTGAAERFVAPLTFEALSHRAVFTSMWQSSEDFSSQHLSLSEMADIMIIAPATADILGKMAGGIADDLVSTLFISSTDCCSVLAAPAMNTRMWRSPAVQANVGRLTEWSVKFIGPERGNLACGVSGEGRMAEPADILAAAKEILSARPPKAGTK